VRPAQLFVGVYGLMTFWLQRGFIWIMECEGSQVPITRDSHGRFLKGTTGNPKGRPTKISMIESADFALFMGTMVEIDNPRGGRKKIFTREGAIQERLYASAMKGNVQAQIFLTRKFEQSKVSMVENEDLLHRIYKVLQKEKRGPTEEEAQAIRSLRIVLNIDPNPGWKVRKERPSRTKRNTTAASDAPPSQERNNPGPVAGPSAAARPTKPSK
jgi:hypothetical protein